MPCIQQYIMLYQWSGLKKGLDLNAFGLELISIGSKDHSIKAVYQDLLTKFRTLVTRKVFSCIIDSVESRASGW